MTARFGRNKRRAARNRIDELERQVGMLRGDLVDMRHRAITAERLSADAHAAGMTEAMRQSGRIDRFESVVRDKLIEQMEPVLRKAAAQVLSALEETNHRRGGRRGFTDLSLQPLGVMERKQTVLRGSVPAIDWNVVVW